MSKSNTYKAGRHFLQVPGSTNIPDRVLRAIDAPAMDHRGPKFQDLSKRILEKIKLIFKSTDPVVIFPSAGTGAMEAALANTLNEGDKVLLDGNDAIIVKIGIRDTVFGVYSERGYTWRYVPNTRIPMLKLEKIVNPELHLDTEEEKAEKLQQMIDALQDKRINENKEAIERLKKR